MRPKVKRIIIPRLSRLLFFIAAFLVIVAVTKVALWAQTFMVTTGLTPLTVLRLLLNTGADLASSDGRTNLLLLGIGGGAHAGADLTDTIMVVSFDIRKKDIAMISVPRDIWSDTLKDKINSAYHYGEEKKAGGGIILSKVIVEDVVGLPIHYALLIDFSGFKNVIDIAGGIDVTVPASFVDAQFPIAGKEEDPCGGDTSVRCRYETVAFDKGPQHMDGERALTYVRSRHAEGEEGSDFARGRRQQEVIVALMHKLKNPWTWLPPSRGIALFHAFDRATITDMRIGELATIGKLMVRSGNDEPKRISFVDLLTEPPLWMYGRYTLVPRESFAAIHAYIKATLDKD